MHVLVTGSAGFIGLHVTRSLLQSGYRVTGIDNFDETLYVSEGRRRRINELSEHPNFNFLNIDLRDKIAMEHVPVPDVVVHEAAIPGLSPSWKHIDGYMTSNVVALANVLDHVGMSENTHIVLASTSSVYGGVGVGREQQSLNPVSPYGISKLAAEHLLWAHHLDRKFTATVLRYFSVYGPRQRPDMAYARFCDALLQDRPLQVTGDGTQTRSVTYIQDVVDATLAAVSVRIDGVTLNISGDEEVSVLDVIDVLADELKVRPQISYLPWRRGDQVRTRGDSSEAERLLEWRPRVTVDAGLRAQAQAALQDHQILGATAPTDQ